MFHSLQECPLARQLASDIDKAWGPLAAAAQPTSSGAVAFSKTGDVEEPAESRPAFRRQNAFIMSKVGAESSHEHDLSGTCLNSDDEVTQEVAVAAFELSLNIITCV